MPPPCVQAAQYSDVQRSRACAAAHMAGHGLLTSGAQPQRPRQGQPPHHPARETDRMPLAGSAETPGLIKQHDCV